MDFNDIIGHEKNIEVFKKSLQNKSLSHSFLFEGEESIGKKKVAFVLSKTILCEKELDKPCNVCSSCLKFDHFNHPDFSIIKPENGTIKKEEIEKLIKNTLTSPFQSKKKIFLIDESDKMTIEAQNSLLKTLEEPPSYVNIILISSNTNRLLSTILSRTQRINFYPVEGEKIVKILVDKYNKRESQARFIQSFTKGAIGKSISLCMEDNFFSDRDIIIQLIDDIIKGNTTKIFNSIQFFNENKEKIEEILDIFLYWFRDLSIYKEIGESDLLVNKDKLQNLSLQSIMDSSKINDIIEKIELTKININKNMNYQLSIETMLFSIQEEL